MPAYYIGAHDIGDPATFAAYIKRVVPMIEGFGGRYLTKGGAHRILEGDWRPERLVIIEFPDMAALNAWFDAPEYQPLKALRQGAARDWMVALEGV